jgi:hypothetical protein
MATMTAGENAQKFSFGVEGDSAIGRSYDGERFLFLRLMVEDAAESHIAALDAAFRSRKRLSGVDDSGLICSGSRDARMRVGLKC